MTIGTGLGRLWACVFILLCAVLPSGAVSQDDTPKIVVTGFSLLETDMDARVNWPEYDWNGNKCAIIKVETTLTGFTFDTGTIAITKSENRTGEIWVYVSPGVRKFNIYHPDYGVCRYEIPVTIETASVYSLKLAVTGGVMSGTFVTNAVVSSNYLKMNIIPKEAVVHLGTSDSYELATQVVTDGLFSMKLEYGEYFYRVENSMYETEAGRVVLAGDTGPLNVTLMPAYNYVSISSSPDSGADVFINGEYAGKTPFEGKEKYRKGKCDIRLVHKDYHPFSTSAELSGDGSRSYFSFSMAPRYAIVTCRCPDSSAEIWVDQEYRGKGEWTGRLGSAMAHTLEARRDGYHSQSISFQVTEGETSVQTVGAPVPLYATLDITSAPSGAEVSIDGQNVGRTPVLKQVLACSHEIAVSKEGYGTEKVSVTLEHGEERTVSVSLEPQKKSVQNSYTGSSAYKAPYGVSGNVSYTGSMPKKVRTRPGSYLVANTTFETRAFSGVLWGAGLGYQFGGSGNFLNLLITEEYLSNLEEEYLPNIWTTNLRLRMRLLPVSGGRIFIEPAVRLNCNVFSDKVNTADFARLGDGPGLAKGNSITYTGMLSLGFCGTFFTTYIYGGYDITPTYSLQNPAGDYWIYDTDSFYDSATDTYESTKPLGFVTSRFVFGISFLIDIRIGR